MALTAIDIYKLLPKTNSRKCGQPTCLAFAMQIAAGKASIDQCPTASEEAREKLSAAAAPPLPKVTIGTGEREVVLGDETVLFRHEKTFYHPTAIAVSIRDDASDEKFASRLAAIRRLSFERVGQSISVDLVALRCASGDADRYARAAAAALEATGLPLVLLAPAGPLAAAVEAVAPSRPLLAPPPEDLVPAARLAAERKLPLRVRARGIEGLSAALADARAAGAVSLVADPSAETPREAVSFATNLRRLAILARVRDLAYPSAFDLGGGFPDPFLAAALLVAKYGSLLVLDSADPADLLPLLTLRQNLFTDPQRPIQVEAGVYPIGAPSGIVSRHHHHQLLPHLLHRPRGRRGGEGPRVPAHRRRRRHVGADGVGRREVHRGVDREDARRVRDRGQGDPPHPHPSRHGGAPLRPDRGAVRVAGPRRPAGVVRPPVVPAPPPARGLPPSQWLTSRGRSASFPTG